ncbi:hypothetical protein Dimus_032508 [Dionaea muscipula]
MIRISFPATQAQQRLPNIIPMDLPKRILIAILFYVIQPSPNLFDLPSHLACNSCLVGIGEEKAYLFGECAASHQLLPHDDGAKFIKKVICIIDNRSQPFKPELYRLFPHLPLLGISKLSVDHGDSFLELLELVLKAPSSRNLF